MYRIWDEFFIKKPLVQEDLINELKKSINKIEI